MVDSGRQLHELELGDADALSCYRPRRLRPSALGRVLLSILFGSAICCFYLALTSPTGFAPELAPSHPPVPITPSLPYALNAPPDPAYNYAFEEDTLAHRGFPSSFFAPLVVRDCTHLTPAWFAPCVAMRTPFADRTYAEELIYPDFGLPLPVFAKPEHETRWKANLGAIDDRGVYKEGYVLYKSQHGQNFVVNDVEYHPEGLLDEWKSNACMGAGSRLGDLKLDRPVLPENYTRPASETTAILINSPDSWSFQHWLDRVAHVLAQSAHLTKDRSRVVLTGRLGSGFVEQMWNRIGFASDQILHRPARTLSYDHLVFSCKTVLIHPFLSWRALELMGLPFATDNWETRQSSTKHVVLYMSRSDALAQNRGRQVLNEAEVVSGIEQLLVTRQKNESLVHFSAIRDRFESDLDGLINYLWTNVAAILGPHGGAIMNHRFTGPGTLVLEFLPTSRLEYINFEEASMLNQTYAAVVVEPAEGSKDDMVIDVPDVTTILEHHLGQPRSEGVVLSYQWSKE